MIGSWQDRLLYFFVSLKNQSFTKDLILWFVDLCDTFSATGLICIVDEPYLFNLKAEQGLDRLPKSDISKLKRISWEIKRKAQKAIRTKRSKRVSVVSWQQMSNVTPEWMKTEVTTAFDARGRFYRQVLEQVALARGSHQPVERLAQYAGFFLCEVPVLIHAYYSDPRGLVDVYPGDNADVLWRIEMGELQEELPRTTAFALAGSKLVYLNVSTDNICPEV